MAAGSRRPKQHAFLRGCDDGRAIAGRHRRGKGAVQAGDLLLEERLAGAPVNDRETAIGDGEDVDAAIAVEVGGVQFFASTLGENGQRLPRPAGAGVAPAQQFAFVG